MSPKVLAILQQQVGMDDHIPNVKNPAGLHIQFSKIGESNQDEGHFANYRAYVPGAPKDQTYLRAIWKIGTDPQFMPGEIYLNSQGLLMSKKPRLDEEYKAIVDPDDEVEFSFQVARGEPVRVLLTTPDGKTVIPGTIVPFPIQGRDKQCKLEARLALPEAAAVLIDADGLAPNSDIPFQTLSEGQAHSGTLHTNAHGHAARIELPYVTGKDAGNLKVTIETKECSTSVEIPWGKGSYHPF
jgi:hypothetical protein